jgi:AcrR family transcriptional regulator
VIASQRAHTGVEETRARILTATREIFELNGTRGTTTREVALRAGVNEATLFRHFGSKASLLAAMREEACGINEFRETLSGLDGRDIVANLRAIAGRAVENMYRQRALLCIALAEDAYHEENENAPEWRGPGQILTLLTRYFEQRVSEGRLVGDPEFLARSFMGMMFQYVLARRLWRSREINSPTVDGLVDLFLNGVRR